MVFRRTIL